MPDRGQSQLSQATRILQKRTEMLELEDALTAQKQEFCSKMESLHQRRDELEKKKFQLKESLQKFDKFLNENDTKRIRALKKASDERSLIWMREKEILRLKDETLKLQLQKAKVQDDVEKHKCFHKYLTKVVETADDFSEIRELIDRYGTLTSTYQDLIEYEQESQDILDAGVQDLVQYREEKSTEILHYHNKLSTLQARYDEAQSKTVKLESAWEHIRNTATMRTLKLGQVKMSTRNLYLLIQQHNNIEEKDTEISSVEQLQKIKQFIMDLSRIIKEIQQQLSPGQGKNARGSFSGGTRFAYDDTLHKMARRHKRRTIKSGGRAK